MIPASFSGNLTADPEGREVGTSYVARFTVAVDDGYRDAKGQWQDNPTLFVNVEAWGAVARGVIARVKRGSPVTVAGRWRAAEYEKDGQKRRRQYVVADGVGATLFAANDAHGDEGEGDDEDTAGEADSPEGDFWEGAK